MQEMVTHHHGICGCDDDGVFCDKASTSHAGLQNVRCFPRNICALSDHHIRMPNAKRARESSASSDAPAPIPSTAAADMSRASGDTPFDAFFVVLRKFVEEHRAVGYTIIRGINADDEEEDSEEESDDKRKKYTAEQMDAIRVLIITESREKLMKKADKFASGGQAGSGFCMFNTHSGNVIIMGIPHEISKVSKLKTAAERFDGLLALTYALGKWDYWFEQQLLCHKLSNFHT
jgi:hypothetical protein